jgi:hypothetical protein
MRQAFPDAEVTGYEHLIATLSLPDANDRHVLAAAIAGGAEQIITMNIRDFPKAALALHGIEPLSPDRFLLDLFDDDSDLIVATIFHRAAELTRPSIGVNGVLEALRKAGTPRFADAVAAALGRR